MKKRLLSIIIVAVLLFCSLPLSAFAEQQDGIVILYENDVHCVIEGYSTLAALKKELQQEYAHVGVVSSGDFLQGGSLGSISRGEYIVRLMNLVGYDAIALGNHEFDYGLERLYELSDMLDTKPVCANFKRIGGDECFEPYSIVSYGDVKIAYIGIITPTTPDTTSFPTQFVDENKEPLYTFSKNDIAEVVQENVNKARAEGADLVIALSHIGDKDELNAAHIVANTVGLDVVLDAHSHSVIGSDILLDKDGNKVVYSSTGTKFANVGKLTISKDGITAELISLEDYTATDPATDQLIAEIMAEYTETGNKKVAESDFELVTHDSEGNRIIRISETNLGNIISDALRKVLGADIAYFNGGAIRSNIEAGEITYNDLLNVLPFNNTGVVVEVSGSDILQMLEVAVAKWPQESATFPHVSGLTFSVNTLGEENNRVYNVKIQNSESGKYEALEPDKKYTVASSNFILLECGDGMTMFEGAQVVSDTGVLDIEVFESYLVNELGGIIGEKYAAAEQRITFTEGELTDDENTADSEQDQAVVIWIAAGAGLLTVAIIAAVLLVRRKKQI